MEDKISEIRDLILRNKKPSYSTTNKKEVRVRCPYCGDSRRDQSAAHMYIEMKPPFRFHCFKCETSGVLNNNTLRDLGIYENSITTNLVSLNREFSSLQKIQKVSIKKNKNIRNDHFESLNSYNSVNYFNNRYGTSLDGRFITEKFNAVLDAPSFFNSNNIYMPTNFYDFNNSIGFLSSDNSHIIFRDISGQQKRRYYNCNILNDDSGSKIYNIKTSLNALSPTVNLVITEGIFDIIGVYLHFYMGKSEDNTIFAAACGKGFNAVILNYIREGFLDMNITIYSDADVDLQFYKDLKRSSPYLKNSRITVYYNSLYNKNTGFGKDYGVPSNQIKLRKIII